MSLKNERSDAVGLRLRLLPSVSASLIGRLTLVAAPLVMIPLFVNALSASDYGLWLTIISTTNYLGLLNLGMSQTLASRLPTLRQNPSAASELIAATTTLAALIVLAAWAVLSLLLLFGELSWLPQVQSAPVAWIAASFFLFGIPNQISLVCLRAYGRIPTEQSLLTTGAILRYGALAAALVLNVKLVGLAIINGFFSALPGLVGWLRVRTVESHIQIPALRLPRKAVVIDILKPSASFLILQSAFLLVFGVDNVIIAAMLGPDAVPGYAIPMQIAFVLTGLLSLVSSSAAPYISAKAHASKDHTQLRGLYLDLVQFCLAAASASSVVLVLCGDALLRLWLHKELPGANSIIPAIAVFLCIQASLLPADALLTSTLRHGTYSVITLVEGALNLALSLWWVRTMGAQGVLLATIVARTATTGWFLHVTAAHYLDTRISSVLRPMLIALAPPLAIAAFAKVVLAGAIGSVVASVVSVIVACAVALIVALPAARRMISI